MAGVDENNQRISTICLITPGHIHSNPRLRKEVNALSRAGFKVHVFGIQTIDEIATFDEAYVAENPMVSFYFLNALKKGRYDWLRIKTSLRKRFFHWLNLISNAFCVQSFSRFYAEQVQMVKHCRADLYIAHNLAALPVAAQVAQKHQKPFAFDAEDFHRGEFPQGSGEQNMVQCIENHFLPQVAYMTAASPLIAAAYRQLYPSLSPVTINNVFSLDQQPPQPPAQIYVGKERTLKLFWFSQTVGRNRGIEDLLHSLNLLSDIPIQIGLLGSCSEETSQYISSFATNFRHQIDFFPQTKESALIYLSAQYDVGMALEKSELQNRDLCLTNKIFTYLLAGNAILASETAAQKEFMKAHSKVGYTYPSGDIHALAKIIRYWWENPDVLLQMRQTSWNLARQELHWGKEQECFLKVVKSIV